MRPLRTLLAPIALLALAGCGANPRPVEAGNFLLTIDEGGLQVEHVALGSVLEDLRFVAGAGSSDVEMQFGAFHFDGVAIDRVEQADVAAVVGRRAVPVILELTDKRGEALGLVSVTPAGDTLVLDFNPVTGLGKVPDAEITSPVAGFSAACDREDHFFGLGAHALDVDHVGEAFSLWVQEPGIGKSDTDERPPGWPLTGARHDTSFPAPVLVRPHRSQALVVEDTAKIDVDLCATDPDRFEVLAWREGNVRLVAIAAATPLETIQRVGQVQGGYELPPKWAFGPWNDAIRGVDRVNEVADRLRAFGASSTAIWVEDWKGGSETPTGYRLSGEWSVDETLYPEPEALAASLEARGFHWMGYFSPFLIESTSTAWQEAEAAGVLVQTQDGEPYVFQGVSFKDTALVDLSSEAGRDWAKERMTAAIDLGIDGWMADFAEWLPVDAELAGGQDAFRFHNAYPLWWQQTNAEAVEGTDAVFYVRSGWLGTRGMVPMVWAGDQRTDFQTDDGFPTLIPMALGLAASGVPVFTHDIAGYNSVGNDPSDKELWFRWASLGAFSPNMRTHHGAFDQENWQFDSDDETTEHWAAMTRLHSKFFPYRYALAAKAADDGTPMLLPVGFVYPDQPLDRMDAWLLGEQLLVAPVLERGATSRAVALPEGRWYRYPGTQAYDGGQEVTVTAELDEIPVFVRGDSVLPLFFTDIPDTYVSGPGVDEGLVTVAEADRSREVYVFGDGGSFTEADGTTYTVTGTSDGSPMERVVEGREVRTQMAGLTIEVTGPVERSYTFLAVP